MKLFVSFIFAVLMAVAMASSESKLAKVCVGAKYKPAPGGWMRLKPKAIKSNDVR